jgi:membrane-bound ClpP family serine protease
MHFIQNSWFTHNWIFLLLFLIGSVAVIAYINNRKVLYQYTSGFFLLLLGLIFYFVLLPEMNESLSLGDNLISSISIGKSAAEKISTFSKFINFLLDIIKDKLGD